MGEIRFVGTGETRGYLYLVCKKVRFILVLSQRAINPKQLANNLHLHCENSVIPSQYGKILHMYMYLQLT